MPAADRLPNRRAAEVLVAACALREGNDLHPPRVGRKLDHRFPAEVGRLELWSTSVRSLGIDRAEREFEPAEVLW